MLPRLKLTMGREGMCRTSRSLLRWSVLRSSDIGIPPMPHGEASVHIRDAALQATQEYFMVCCGLSHVRTILGVLLRSKQRYRILSSIETVLG